MKWTKFLAVCIGIVIASFIGLTYASSTVVISVSLGMIGAYFHAWILSPLIDRWLG
jgi:ABC-type dipeptide/oligopeptide/nickel transport system permease subunit